MKLVCIVEFLAGWLAVASGIAIMLRIWGGGFIAPEFVSFDLTVFSLILAVIALSVTLESVTGSLAARIILALGAVALTGVFVVSFVVELGIPAVLALAATFMAFSRHLLPSAPRRA